MEYTYSIFISLFHSMKTSIKESRKEKTIFAWPKKNQLLTLLLCLIIPLLAGVIGSWFTMPAIDVPYLTIIKPVFTAPNRLFGPVWSVLFLFMGVSLFLVARDGIQEKDKPAMRYFVIQLFLNILRSILFFYLQNPLIAFIEIIVLWIFIVVTAYEFGKVNKKAGWIFLPYILRVTFAAVLNYSIMILN